MSQLSKVKQNIHQHKDKSCNLKDTKRQTWGPTGLYELFLLTVPIEEVARCQYKTVLIIFPLNLQTITITSDVVKWRSGVQMEYNILQTWLHNVLKMVFNLAYIGTYLQDVTKSIPLSLCAVFSAIALHFKARICRHIYLSYGTLHSSAYN